MKIRPYFHPAIHPILQPILAELGRVDAHRDWLESFYFDGNWTYEGIVEPFPERHHRYHLFWLYRRQRASPDMPSPCLLVREQRPHLFLLPDRLNVQDAFDGLNRLRHLLIDATYIEFLRGEVFPSEHYEFPMEYHRFLAYPPRTVFELGERLSALGNAWGGWRLFELALNLGAELSTFALWKDE
ncbi:MAG: hypothetical protein HY360_10950 [Verrucomicrobia bacterium]|nr:hypothetical protein [Verrucomicrobiota bacterium]